jgi:hypothetical protein
VTVTITAPVNLVYKAECVCVCVPYRSPHFRTNLNQIWHSMTLLAPRGTQFIGGPPIHSEGGKIGKSLKTKVAHGGRFLYLILFMTFSGP